MSRIVEKIRKLLNLASNEAASPNEADVARQLAEQLMAASGITADDVLDAATVDPSTTVRSEPSPEFESYGNIVAAAVARIVGCYVYTTKLDAHRQRCRGCDAVQGVHDHVVDGGRVCMWIGTDDQRDAAIELHAWVVRQIERLAEVARNRARETDNPRRWLTSYRLGIASAIAEQAREMVAYRSTHAPVAGQALVVRENVTRAINRAKAELNLRRSRGTRAKDSGGFASGKQDGASVGLRRSVVSGQKRLGGG